MVICFADKAREIDPAAFKPGSLIVYWPDFTDERQRRAYEAATNPTV
jgi:hypothetical protein